MNYCISEDNFEKLFIILRTVTDLNNRLANAGNDDYKITFLVSCGMSLCHADIWHSATQASAGSYIFEWNCDSSATEANYEGMIAFLKEWEKKLFPEEKISEKCALEAFYIEKPVEKWANHVYECSACGQEFMVDRRLPNWCPSCGRALDCDVNGELEKGE